jgi:cell volume regulation protein A
LNDAVTLALIISSIIIVIGFLSNWLFDRTGLPDMLFLITLGVVVGPVLRIFNPASLFELAPYLAAVALVFILFDGGLRMNLYQVFSESPRAASLAIIGFVFSTIAIALVMHLIVGVPLLYGILFGSILGGSSSIVVVSLARRIKVSEKCSTVLTLESAVTDILCIVVSLAVIGIIMSPSGQAQYLEIGKEIAGKFSIGAVVGVIFGIIWLTLLKKVANIPYAYMLTLAVVLSAYSVSEVLGGNGALSSLLFGIVLGNEKDILKIFKQESTRGMVIDAGLKRFEAEIAFLVRSFFFVYLGLITTVNDVGLIIFGAILSFLLLGVRYLTVRLATIRSELCEERSIMSVILTRGLAAAVLSTLPMQYGLLYSDLYINMSLVIIITTAVICTAGIMMLPYIGKKRQG